MLILATKLVSHSHVPMLQEATKISRTSRGVDGGSNRSTPPSAGMAVGTVCSVMGLCELDTAGFLSTRCGKITESDGSFFASG